jgi:hypothetical protein
MNKINFIFVTIVLVSGFLFSGQSVASEKLYYAGIGYMGSFEARNSLYKYSADLFEHKDRIVEDSLLKRLNAIENKNIEISTDELVDHDKEVALTLAFALENESVSTERIGDAYKVYIDIRANILVFDHNEMKVVALYPIAIQLRDKRETLPSDAELKAIIRELYISNRYGINIFDEVEKRLSSLELKPSYSETIKVSKVSISGNSQSEIPDLASNKGDEGKNLEDHYKAFLAQVFTTYLSKNQNVSVLPYTEGEVIGATMKTVMSNGKKYSLKIPDETYSIELELLKLKKAKLGENKYKSVWGYANYFNVKLLIPDVDKVLMDAKFRGLVQKEIIKSSTHTVNDWPIYKESVYILFDNLTKNISERDSDWLASVTATKNIEEQLEKFNEKIISCQ